jgi:hypothetical protein
LKVWGVLVLSLWFVVLLLLASVSPLPIFLKMVQQSEFEAAGTQPTEHSPLLSKSGNTNGQSGTYVSIEEVVGENGTTISKNADEDHDEESQSQGRGEVEEVGIGRSQVARIIAVLLIGSSNRPFQLKFLLLTRSTGIFVAHADSSILMATHPVIASEFNDLGNSSWLIISFTLAGAATQTLVLTNSFQFPILHILQLLFSSKATN